MRAEQGQPSPPRAVSAGAFALPATARCQSAATEHSSHEFCVLVAYKMLRVSLSLACRKKKDCIGAIGRMTSSNMVDKYCALFIRL